MTLVFENPGVIDPRGITTMGVNVKENDSPIGYFGTGLKYALCVILRLGGSVTIHAGERVHRFGLRPFTMRGKEFQAVTMDDQELGFTTELGKNWEPWMAYRELHSNARDEGGRGYTLVDDDLPAREDYTQIVVECREIDTAHLMRNTFLIEDRTPRFTVPGVVEVYDGVSEYIFYRGIRAGELPAGKRSRFTYNILRQCDLTEDRTLDSSYYARLVAEAAITRGQDAAFIAECVTEKSKEFYEHHITFEYDHNTPSSTFFAVMEQLKKDRAGDLNQHAVSKVKRHAPKSAAPDGRPFTDHERAMLEQAKDFARSIGYACDSHDIRCAETLGDETLAIALPKEGKIILSAECFRQGLQLVVHALIEEHLHIVTGYGDCSRQMQSHLFREIIRLGEELSGVSLSQPLPQAAE